MISFIDAIYDGNVQAVRDHLQAEVELANTKSGDITPLYRACVAEQYEVADLLLSFGANPDETNDDGETPLHVVSFNGLEKFVALLINARTDVNAATEDGKTILMNAAQSGNLAVVNMLLEAGANASSKDNQNRNALHWACVGDHDNADVVRLLLAAGTDRDRKNNNGDTPLQYSQVMQKAAITTELLRK